MPCLEGGHSQLDRVLVYRQPLVEAAGKAMSATVDNQFRQKRNGANAAGHLKVAFNSLTIRSLHEVVLRRRNEELEQV